MKQLNIVKATGEVVPFSEEKYSQSLRRSGASNKEIDKVLEKIHPHMHDRMTTRELYKITHQILSDEQLFSVGGRYYLRDAMRKLGPSGFPFERYYAELLKRQGYSVLVDAYVMGKCVEHEADVIATKHNERLMIECKFHSSSADRCHIQTCLYVKARYDDVKMGCEQDHSCKPKYSECWLITNTKFTSVAIDYAVCVGLKLLGWSYPKDQGLEKIIDQAGLHPITCLSFITKELRQELFNRGIVFCRDLMDKGELLKSIGLKEKDVANVVAECAAICNIEGHQERGLE